MKDGRELRRGSRPLDRASVPAEPVTTVAESPPGLVASPSARFAFRSSVPGERFECRRDGGAWSSCGSPRSERGLAQGAHSFTVRARDAAGNWSPALSVPAFTVDTVAPDTRIDGGPGTFTLGSPDPSASFECRIDSAAVYTPCAPSHTPTGLEPGEHRLRVRAVDPAGNRDGSPASIWFGV